MEKLIKLHALWTFTLIGSFVMLIVTGHQMLRESKKEQ